MPRCPDVPMSRCPAALTQQPSDLHTYIHRPQAVIVKLSVRFERQPYICTKDLSICFLKTTQPLVQIGHVPTFLYNKFFNYILRHSIHRPTSSSGREILASTRSRESWSSFLFGYHLRTNHLAQTYEHSLLRLVAYSMVCPMSYQPLPRCHPLTLFQGLKEDIGARPPCHPRAVSAIPLELSSSQYLLHIERSDPLT